VRPRAQGRAEEQTARIIRATSRQHVRQQAYPVIQKSGILWAYLGEGEPPAFPDFDCFVAPDSHVFAFKGWWECNWLQALEVGIDPAHASFLHRYFQDEDPKDSYGRQFRSSSSDTNIPMTQVLREHDRPEIRVEKTDWGQRLITLRTINEQHTHVRVTNTIFPQAFLIPMSDEITISQWHVPIDDENTCWYTIFTSFGSPIDKQRFREIRLKTYPAPDYRPIFNQRNRYGFNPEEQRSQTYTGMGMDINIHDQWACESQGRIQDRTREHLGTSDRGIATYRRMLLEAIATVQKGGKPLMCLDASAAHALRGPATLDGLGPTSGWESYWPEVDERRRINAPWARANAVA